MIELLAALSASAAAGIRIALPLLVIGLIQGDDLWNKAPILSQFYPPVVLGVLVSWSILEVFLSKERLGLRLLQMVQLCLSPLVGAIAAVSVVAYLTEQPPPLMWLIGLVGGLLAFVLQVVQVGLFYRRRGLPLWFIFGQDVLCILLVVLAFGAPLAGGLIALALLWLAIRSSSAWRRWRSQLSSSDLPTQRSPLQPMRYRQRRP